ncbi:MAG: Imm32 family immunity protein [Pseudomonadota bacterium]
MRKLRIVVEIIRPPANEEPSEVNLRLDSEGVDALIHQLTNLKEKKTEHVHLMSPSWGMEIGGLSEEFSDDSYLVHHLKIRTED